MADMKYINTKTLEIITIRGINTVSRNIYVNKQDDAFSNNIIDSIGYSVDTVKNKEILNYIIETYGKDFLNDYIPIEEYNNWEHDTTLSRYNCKYRIYVSTKTLIGINVNPDYRGLLKDIKKENIHQLKNGLYVYIDNFEVGHREVVENILKLVIEENPNDITEVDNSEDYNVSY